MDTVSAVFHIIWTSGPDLFWFLLPLAEGERKGTGTNKSLVVLDNTKSSH
jgi:hypothetical protein